MRARTEALGREAGRWRGGVLSRNTAAALRGAAESYFIYSPKICSAVLVMIPRTARGVIERHVRRGKSILLLGPRQTGKTTLLRALQPTLTIELVEPRERRRFERDPTTLRDEALALGARRPLILVDEVQKAPAAAASRLGSIDAGRTARDRRRARVVRFCADAPPNALLIPSAFPEGSRAVCQRGRTAVLYGARRI